MNNEYPYEYSSLSSPSSSSSGTDQRLYSDNNSGSNGKSPLSSLVSESPPQLVSHKKRAGRKKFKETRHPIYRGVRERKNDKWVCEVREPNNSKSRIWLGTHSSPEMAARAYDVAALALRGKSAPLNFENSSWVLPRAKSSSIKDIQAAVSEASLAFPFSPDSGPSPMMTNRVSQTFPSKQLSRRVENNVDEVLQESSSTFLDEEALFNMPSLIASMAEGMLLDPPQEGYYFDDVEYGVDSNLWSDSAHSYEYSNSPSSSSSTDQTSLSDLEELIQSSVLAPELRSHKKRAGRKIFKETRHPVYRGVRLRKNDKWVCEVREPNSKSRIWLGTHSTPEMAATAYDVAALALRGNLTPLNFEDSLWVLPRAKSSAAKDIQIAAAEAARAFPLPTHSKSPSIRKKPSQSATSKASRPVAIAEIFTDISLRAEAFFDEEALYYMPALITSMVEGMLLDPPPQEFYYFDALECRVDSSLWSA
ncbi:hypothetical protein MKW92_017120 [Papaver armeniacum]|nr:hypothetical protein MKW92_017120 [Papaver armeniacum]